MTSNTFNSEPEILEGVIKRYCELLVEAASDPRFESHRAALRQLAGHIEESFMPATSLATLKSDLWHLADNWADNSRATARRLIDRAVAETLRITPGKPAPHTVVNRQGRPKRGFNSRSDAEAWARANEPYYLDYSIREPWDFYIKWGEPSPYYSNA